MRFITTFLLSVCFLLSTAVSGATLEQLTQELKQAEHKSVPYQQEWIKALQQAIQWKQDTQAARLRAQHFKKTIDDFPQLAAHLQKQLNAPAVEKKISATLPSEQYEQLIIQTSSQLLELERQLQHEETQVRNINDSLSQLPAKQSELKKALYEVSVRLSTLSKTDKSPLLQAQRAQLQAETEAREAQLSMLDLEQLSVNNRQELARLQISLLKKRHEVSNRYLQTLRDYLHTQRQKENDRVIQQAKQLAEQSEHLPTILNQQLQLNQTLSVTLNQQTKKLEQLIQQQQQVKQQIQQVRNTLTTLREQAKWLTLSPTLGEMLRAQVAKLPDMPPSRKLDSEMAQLRLQQLNYENLMESLDKTPAKQHDDVQLTPQQHDFYVAQQHKTKEILQTWLMNSKQLMLEFSKLNVAYLQLHEALQEVHEASHRYLFWTADIPAVGLHYFINVFTDLPALLSLDTFSQLGHASMQMLSHPNTLFSLFAALLLVVISINSRRYYSAFLDRAAAKVGKVTRDRFGLTLRTVFWSILIAAPLPILLATFGAGLQHAWSQPIAVAIGKGINETLPLLWVFMISASFARPKGLFIQHFQWSPARIARVFHYYRLSIWVIVPLTMAVISFDQYNEREFAATLGRMCFLLLCAAVFTLTTSLKKVGTPLYLDKKGSSDNVINAALWWCLLCAPILAAVASLIGYLSTAQILLARLETSVAIWFGLLIIYYVIRRWMLIQLRKIAFERAKQRRADMLAQRAKSGEDASISAAENSIDIEDPEVDLDTLRAQSLRLVRSILMLIALALFILLWSEMQFAFGFLQNIHLWTVSTSIHGMETVQPITLGSLLIVILVLMITLQLIRNLPALLELAILPHFNLTPGTGYALTTITKYVVILIGCMISSSTLGLDWAKLQWLIAALGLGLGFGLQEIFANFISGLIILFEKPIRIGDTITIRGLTGTVTRINTRATTLCDWDRKEIIVPNKAFITEQFTNWSLTDTLTRVVLYVPAPTEANSDEVTQWLLKAASDCALALKTPAPEAYLIDLQQGIQIFELRVFAAEMGHRMPLRHAVHQHILIEFEQHGLTLPFPPFQVRRDIVNIRSAGLVNPAVPIETL